jgi:predicted O-methyltransferase YrrM
MAKISASFENIKKLDGWLRDEEIKFLKRTSNKLRGFGDIVEIGSWKGKSTIAIASSIRNSKTMVYAIDHHKGSKEHKNADTFAEFKKNVKDFGLEKNIVPLVMKSVVANKYWEKAPKAIEMLWIDGSHEYSDVKKDFLLWNKYLIDGGIIALHDTFFWDGPRKVVNEFIFPGNFKKIGFVGDITFATKCKKCGPAQKLINSLKRLERDVIFVSRKYSMSRIKEYIKNHRN